MRHAPLTLAAVALAAVTGQTAAAQSFQPCQVLVGFQPRHAVAFEGDAVTLNIRADFRGNISDDYELLVEYETDSEIKWQGQSHTAGLGPDSGVSSTDYAYQAATIALTPSEPSRSIVIQTLADDEAEGSERLYVNLNVPWTWPTNTHRTRDQVCAEPLTLLDRYGFSATVHIRDR